MAAEAWLSILGLYKHHPNVFIGFRVPTGINRVNVINTILFECAELEFIYPEPEVAEFAITQWTTKEYSIWEELQKTREYDYDPIANVDAKETESRDLKGSRIGSRSGNGQSINSVAAFNSEMSKERERDNTTYSDSLSDGTTDTGTITRERHGNIGVTMTQQLIEAQRNVVEFDVVQYIVDSFKKRFCLLVY